jgi:hypothetical protein
MKNKQRGKEKMKKLILGLGVLGILTTNLLSNEFQCRDLDNLVVGGGTLLSSKYKEICSGSTRGVNLFQTEMGITEEMANKIIGTFSNELLSNKGIGVKTVKSWQNVAFQYNKFLCSMSESERTEFVKFIAFSTFNTKYDREEFIKGYIELMINKNVGDFDSLEFISFVFGNNNFDKQSKNKLFELIMKEKYSEAKSFITSTNNKKGTTAVFNKLKSNCR